MGPPDRGGVSGRKGRGAGGGGYVAHGEPGGKVSALSSGVGKGEGRGGEGREWGEG